VVQEKGISTLYDHMLRAASSINVPAGQLRMLEADLSERIIELPVSDDEGSFSRVMSCGVPQGSVLGLDLWNLLYDDLVSLSMPTVGHVIISSDGKTLWELMTVPRVANSYPDRLCLRLLRA